MFVVPVSKKVPTPFGAMHTPVARTACALRILLLTSAFGREKALPALLECPVNRHQHEAPSPSVESPPTALHPLLI